MKTLLFFFIRAIFVFIGFYILYYFLFKFPGNKKKKEKLSREATSGKRVIEAEYEVIKDDQKKKDS